MATPERTPAVSERRVVVNGVGIFTRTATAGEDDSRPAIVLIHGFIISSRYMVPLLRCLAPWYRVYAPDLPGFGKSDKPDHVLNVDELADVLAAWMVGIGLGSATFVGNSFGSQVVASLAAHHHEIVKALVLVAPSVDHYERTLPRQVLRLLLDATREPLSLIPLHLADFVRAGPRTVLGTLRFMWHDHILQDLPSVAAPTLVVRGDRDPLATDRWVKDVARCLPNSTLAIIPGAAHAVNYNSPGPLARVIHDFLTLQGREQPSAVHPP